MPVLTIDESKERKQFKKLLGHTNHFLITILVGLDAVADGRGVLADSFSTSWNPRNIQESATRSRLFALSATLSWCVDAFDAYIGLCLRSPCLIESKEVRDKLNSAGNSVFRKLQQLRDYFSDVQPIESLLVEVSIAWRNRLVHYFADRPVASEIENMLISNANIIRDEYRGLDVQDLLIHLKQKHKPPTFKEMAGLITATQRLVEGLDSAFLHQLDLRRYLVESLRNHFTNEDEASPRRLQSLWSKDFEKRSKSLRLLFESFGAVTKNDITSGNSASVDLLEEYGRMSYKEVFDLFIDK